MRQVAKFVVLQMLRGYKWALSPMFPPACRFVPTCSEYAMEAVERYGAVRGGGMALLRLLRCHPFARGGYDPVKQTSGTLTSGTLTKSNTPTLRQAQGRLSRAKGAREMGHPALLTSGEQHHSTI